MRKPLTAACALAFAGLAGLGAGRADGAQGVCPAPGAWVDPAALAVVAQRDLFARLAQGRAVLLGETHDNAEHHRWQLHVAAALHALAGDVVLGLEMFPRRVQPALDRWVAGELDERAFLAAAEWDRVWGFDKALYMPLFHFARMNGVPMVALNVERSLVTRVREEGWEAVPESAREGLSAPAPASERYLAWLTEAYRVHLREAGRPADGAIGRDDPQFRGFVAAQLTWDRAMAEAILDAAGGPGRPLVIGIIGSGHLRDGFGVPRQLAALGLADAAVLLPWDEGADCAELTPGLADAVFGVRRPDAAPPPPRLGVLITAGDGGVEVERVFEGSVAQAAGIQAGDVIARAAGRATGRPADLIAVVKRQAPGTWLPLRIERAGETLEIVAKFPAGR